MTVHGLMIGYFARVSRILFASDFQHGHPSIITTLLKDQKPAVYKPTGSSTREACILTLTASQALPHTPINKSYFKVLRKVLQKILYGDTHHRTLSSTPSLESKYFALGSSQNHEAARRVCHQRRHFVTKTGYQGLGPSQIQPGDFVFVAFGGSCPYVLREVIGGYRLVGECYVHGLMDGEAIAEMKAGRRSTLEITLI